MSRFTIFLLLGVYIGISPVYWLPGVDAPLLRQIKLALVGLALIITALSGSRYFTSAFSKGVFGAGGLVALILLSGPALLITSTGDLIKTIQDYLLAFLMMWGGYTAFYTLKSPNRLLIFSTAIMALFCLVVVFSFLTGFPDYRAPSEFGGFGLTHAGFGAKRTGWSNGVALFVPLSFLLLTSSMKNLALKQAIPIVMSLAIVGTQLIVAGRGGIVASFIGLLIVMSAVAPRRLLLPMTVSMSLVVVIALSLYSGAGLEDGEQVQEDLASHFRLDRLEGDGEDRLNRFSAGRLQQFGCAWEKFVESPLIGRGFDDESDCYGADIHNLWLRLLVQSGILPVLFLGYFVYRIVRKMMQTYRVAGRLHREKNSAMSRNLMVYLAVILQGLFISMVEPNALIGSFQATAVWWLVIGYALAQLDVLGRRRSVKRR